MAQDIIPRKRIFDYLEPYNSYKVITAIAPGGFGKSVSIRSWLDHKNLSYSWISLNKRHNDISIFLSETIKALQPFVSEEELRIPELALSLGNVNNELISRALVDDLAKIKKEVFLVFDDCYFIMESLIFQLIEDIITNSNDQIKFVLISREYPPINLSKLKINNQVKELSISDLRFDTVEFNTLLKKLRLKKLSKEQLSEIINFTEGWIIALRFVSEQLLGGESYQNIVRNIKNYSNEYFDFLLDDILSKQPPFIQKYLVLSSLLNQFSSDLINSAIQEDRKEIRAFYKHKDFVNYLINNSLFIIKVNDDEACYRYHHIFQDYLRRQLKKFSERNELEIFFKTITDKLVEKDMIEEALEYAFSINSMEIAVHIFEQKRYELINKEQFGRLNYIVGLFPVQITENNISLLLARALLADARANYVDMQHDLNLAKKFISKADHNEKMGEYYSLLSAKSYLSNEVEKTAEFSEKAIDLLADNEGYLTYFAIAYKSMSLFSSKKLNLSLELIDKRLKELTSYNEYGKTRLLSIKSVILAMDSNMNTLIPTAEGYLSLSKKTKLLMSWTMSGYFIGMGQYQINRLEKAKTVLEPFVDSKFYGRPFWNLNIYFVYLCSLLHLNEEENFNKYLLDLENLVEDLNNDGYRAFLQVMKSEFALLRNDNTAALNYSKDQDLSGFPTVFFSLFPQLNKIKLWLHSVNQTKISKAGKYLDELILTAKNLSNRMLLIQCLALKAIYFEKTNDSKKSVATLVESINLNINGLSVRTYLDLRTLISPAIELLRLSSHRNENIEKILQYFPLDIYRANGVDTKKTMDLLINIANPSISKRELEIIELISKGFTNKQIANMLFISVETVKKHLSSVFKKLHVRNRIGAVIQAGKLNLLKS